MVFLFSRAFPRHNEKAGKWKIKCTGWIRLGLACPGHPPAVLQPGTAHGPASVTLPLFLPEVLIPVAN